MLFFKYEGLASCETWSQENDSRRIMQEKIRKIYLKSAAFNQKLQREAFFFVTDASQDTVTIGMISKDYRNVQKRIEEYIKEVGIELKDTRLEEITFDAMHTLLQRASQRDYIPDDDEVLEQFGLLKLTHRYRFPGEGRYYESLIEDASKREVYSAADKLLSNETLIPELDRIYAGKAKSNAIGHPVHYMIQTDDSDIRKRMYRLLLQALYTKKRLYSKRFYVLKFGPGQDLSKAFYDCLYKSCFGGTVIVRYLADDDTEDDYAACGRETVELMCETMKKYCNQVLTIFCLPRECTTSKALFYENLGNTSFVELKEDFVYADRAAQFLKMLASEQGIKADQKLFAKLEPDKGYLAPELRGLFDAWYNYELKTSIYPQYQEIATVKSEVAKAAPKGSAYNELMEMVGLDGAKKLINQALNYYKAQKLFADKGMKADRPAMHMVFTGNPGTAKTSVARLFAKIMKENGLLSKGNLIEVGRGDLVGKYVGWTAPIIQKKFKEAEGSVLFIDEAYSLVDGRNGSFGDEAINTIVQEMENHREDVIVIFAGYPDQMETFLQKNPGLRSRIAFHIPFADYSSDELCRIAGLIASKKGMKFTEDAERKLLDIFSMAKSTDDFGNGRYVRNVIEQAKIRQATRLLEKDFDLVTSEDIITLCAEDIEIPAASKTSKRQIGFTA